MILSCNYTKNPLCVAKPLFDFSVLQPRKSDASKSTEQVRAMYETFRLRRICRFISISWQFEQALFSIKS